MDYAFTFTVCAGGNGYFWMLLRDSGGVTATSQYTPYYASVEAYDKAIKCFVEDVIQADTEDELVPSSTNKLQFILRQRGDRLWYWHLCKSKDEMYTWPFKDQFDYQCHPTRDECVQSIQDLKRDIEKHSPNPDIFHPPS